MIETRDAGELWEAHSLGVTEGKEIAAEEIAALKEVITQLRDRLDLEGKHKDHLMNIYGTSKVFELGAKLGNAIEKAESLCTCGGPLDAMCAACIIREYLLELKNV